MLRPTLFLLLLCLCGTLQAKDQRVAIVTMTPVAQMIAQALVDETSLRSVYLPPSRLPLNRLPAWLNRADPQQWPSAEALLTYESVWPDLAAYPALRQRSVRLIPIDLAQEIAPQGARIVQTETGQSDSSFFWLDLNNLLLMINLGARDLARLWPAEAQQIERNRQALLLQVHATLLAIDTQLLAQDRHWLIVEDARWMPFASMLGLPVATADQQQSGTAQSLVIGPASSRVSAPNWQIDPLVRLPEITLSEWLDSWLTSLENSAESAP